MYAGIYINGCDILRIHSNFVTMSGYFCIYTIYNVLCRYDFMFMKQTMYIQMICKFVFENCR